MLVIGLIHISWNVNNKSVLVWMLTNRIRILLKNDDWSHFHQLFFNKIDALEEEMILGESKRGLGFYM